LITNENQHVTGFQFDDIDYFNDTIAWVKRDEKWHLLNFLDSLYLQEKVISYYPPENTSEEYLYFQCSEGKGVLNSKFGTIITPTFNNIENVGSIETPVFMAEKYIEEADYYLIVYYDFKGELIYRQAYPAELYGNLFCEK
jgi:hypothetical protein